MGLDITAASRIDFRRVYIETEVYPPPSGDPAFPCIHLWPNPHFPTQSEGLPAGYFRVNGEVLSFRAGSYSGYNWWRSTLARLVGITPNDAWSDPKIKVPFLELINFSDCEGVIGPRTSAKLAGDFAEWEERAAAFAESMSDDESDYWLSSYRDWQQAFQLASDGGAVVFH